MKLWELKFEFEPKAQKDFPDNATEGYTITVRVVSDAGSEAAIEAAKKVLLKKGVENFDYENSKLKALHLVSLQEVCGVHATVIAENVSDGVAARVDR